MTIKETVVDASTLKTVLTYEAAITGKVLQEVYSFFYSWFYCDNPRICMFKCASFFILGCK